MWERPCLLAECSCTHANIPVRRYVQYNVHKRKPVVSLSLSSCVSWVKLTDGRFGGGAQIKERREGLVLYKSFKNLSSKNV
jgi:hypothetical protein